MSIIDATVIIKHMFRLLVNTLRKLRERLSIHTIKCRLSYAAGIYYVIYDKSSFEMTMSVAATLRKLRERLSIHTIHMILRITILRPINNLSVKQGWVFLG